VGWLGRRHKCVAKAIGSIEVCEFFEVGVGSGGRGRLCLEGGRQVAREFEVRWGRPGGDGDEFEDGFESCDRRFLPNSGHLWLIFLNISYFTSRSILLKSSRKRLTKLILHVSHLSRHHFRLLHFDWRCLVVQTGDFEQLEDGRFISTGRPQTVEALWIKLYHIGRFEVLVFFYAWNLLFYAE